MTEPRRLGGLLALRETWCRPDEPILWCCTGAGPRFDVPGVGPDGKPGKGRSALGAALAVADFLTSEDPGSSAGPPEPPAVIASGPAMHAEAPRLAQTAAAEPGLWVYTPYRLAYVAPVSDPAPAPAPQARGLLGKLRSQAENVRAFVTGSSGYANGEPIGLREQRSVFELRPGQFTGAGTAVRERPRFTDREPLYDRFVLADGSLLEFYAGPGGGLLPRTRQTGVLLALTEVER